MAKSKGRFVSQEDHASRASEALIYSPELILRSRRLIRLHDFPHEDVELSVFLFAYLGYFVRPHLISTHNRALLRRSVAGWKFYNDARG